MTAQNALAIRGLYLFLIAAAGLGLPVRAWAFEHGEQLSVVRRSPQMVGRRVIDWVAPLTSVKFLKAEGSWLWVVGNRAGWIRSSDVVTIAEAKRVALAKLPCYPATASGLANRASARAFLKDYAGALADIDRSLRLDPRQPNYHARRGELLLFLRRYSEALGELTQAIEQSEAHDVRLADLYHLRSACRMRLGDKLGVKVDEQCAYDLDPLRPNIVEGLAIITGMEPSGDSHAGDKCLQLMRRACELAAWNDASTVYNFAVIYVAAKDYDRALACARIAETIVPTNEDYAKTRRALVSLIHERRSTVFDSKQPTGRLIEDWAHREQISGGTAWRANKIDDRKPREHVGKIKTDPDALWKRQSLLDDLPSEPLHFQ